MRRFIAITLFIFFASCFSVSYGQKRNKVPDKIKATPVYGALILLKIDVEAEMLMLMETQTLQSPLVKEKQMEIGLIKREIKHLAKMKRSLWSKLNETYAKLVLRKVEVEAKLKGLQLRFTDTYPDVKSVRIKLALLNREIKDFLS